MSALFNIIIFACQVVTTPSPACTMSALFNIIILQAWRCPCPSPAKNLLFPWGLEQTRPARPNGLQVIPLRGPKVLLSVIGGLCQQVELREEGGEPAILEEEHRLEQI